MPCFQVDVEGLDRVALLSLAVHDLITYPGASSVSQKGVVTFPMPKRLEQRKGLGPQFVTDYWRLLHFLRLGTPTSDPARFPVHLSGSEIGGILLGHSAVQE